MTIIPEGQVMKPAVAKAIDELREHFDSMIDIVELPDGGARVVINGIELGAPYQQPDTWVGFTLTPLYPYADVYPHFVRPDLARVDGRRLEIPIHINNSFYGAPAVMVSRRTRSFGEANPNNAVLKLLKVQAWLRSL
jgi:hypothetical protein